jgi:hypothetical protein
MPSLGSNLFSSSSSRKTSTVTHASTGQSYADRNSQAISGLTLSVGKNATAGVTFTDLGAVGRAFDFAEANVREALAQSSLATTTAVAAYRDAQQQAGAVNADELVKIGVGAVVLVVLGLAWAASRKGRA